MASRKFKFFLFDLILCSILLSSGVWAVPRAQISPSALAVTVNTFVPASFVVNVSAINSTNNLVNVSCAGVPFTTFSKADVEINSSKQLSLVILTQSPFHSVYTGTCGFTYLIPVTVPASTGNVFIKNIWFPSKLFVRAGDAIIVHNNDSINHTFTSIDFSIDQLLQPGQTYSFSISGVSEKLFFDRVTNTTMLINVSSNVVFTPAHDLSTDFFFVLDINSVATPSVLVVDNFIKSFDVVPGESVEGVLRVSNIGDHDLLNVRLSANFISFSDNGFSLVKGSDKIVNYKLSLPADFVANISSNVSIVVMADNFNGSIVETVFVRSKFVRGVNGTDLGFYYAQQLAFVKAREEFCTDFPDDVTCGGGVRGNITLVRVLEPVYKYNFSENVIGSMVATLHDVPAVLDRQTNVLKDFRSTSENIKHDLSNLNTRINFIEESERKRVADFAALQARQDAFFDNSLFIVIVVNLCGLIFYFWTKKKQRDVIAAATGGE